MITWEALTGLVFSILLRRGKVIILIYLTVPFRGLIFGLTNGGPAGLVYGYLFVWCGASLQALVMAEMASMYVNTAPDVFRVHSGPYKHAIHLRISSMIHFAVLAKWLSSLAWRLLMPFPPSFTDALTGFRLRGGLSTGFPSCLLRLVETFSATWRGG